MYTPINFKTFLRPIHYRRYQVFQVQILQHFWMPNLKGLQYVDVLVIRTEMII